MPYSITSSACARTVGGTEMPSARAVVRLITRSNLVGCSTGMSAGLVPRKILSIMSAERLKRSTKFEPSDVEAADVEPFARGEHGRQPRGQGQCGDAESIRRQQPVVGDIEPIRTPLEAFHSRHDLLRTANFDRDGFEPKRAGRRFDLVHLQDGEWTCYVGHDCNPAQGGNDLAQYFKPFAGGIDQLIGKTSNVSAGARQLATKPVPTGSPATAKTIGMTDATCLAMRASGFPVT